MASLGCAAGGDGDAALPNGPGPGGSGTGLTGAGGVGGSVATGGGEAGGELGGFGGAGAEGGEGGEGGQDPCASGCPPDHWDIDSTPGCDQFAYKEPTVPFGELPAIEAAIEAAMDAEAPDGFNTPTYPALGGAILEGIEIAENNPGEVSAVLLVTDGQPQGPADLCGGVDPEDPQVIAALAATGAGYDPPVVTYVVGLPGVDQSSANLIAEAGGSESAILVGATNVQEEFQQALLQVRGEAVPCTYELPEEVIEGYFTISEVNIEITPSDGSDPYLLPYDPDCAGDGWTYDDPDHPTEIVLCPATCDSIKADLGAAIKVVLGCQTILK